MATIIVSPAPSLTITDPTASDTITVFDGPIQGGFQTTEVLEATQSIATIFANQTAVTISGTGGADDAVILANPDPAAGLQSLSVGQPGQDDVNTINGSS